MTNFFEVGQPICIQEIVDGEYVDVIFNSDGSIEGNTDFISRFSLDKLGIKSKVLYGWWTCNMSDMNYKPATYDNWYIKDIYDTEKNRFFTQKEIFNLCIKHNLLCADVKYIGEYKSIKQCLDYMKPAYGEKIKGIYIKDNTGAPNMTTITFIHDVLYHVDKDGRTNIINLTELRDKT